jgi:phosphate transport system substrate-binding protein
MKNVTSTAQLVACRCLLVAVMTGLFLTGCGPVNGTKGGKPGQEAPLVTETITSGVIKIGGDVTMEPILQQLVDAFHIDYEAAKVSAKYAPEGAIMADFLADSVRLVIVSRLLNKVENQSLFREQLRPTTTMIARDAVVAILHPDNPMDSITMEQLGMLMRGEAKTWKDLGGSVNDTVNLVFDAPTSSTVRLLMDKFLEPGKPLPRNAYQASSQDKVVEYVSQSKNAIGFVGYCQVADRDDPNVRTVLSQVKLARLDAADSSDAKGYFIRPFQNEIALGRYPLSRPVYAISREHFNGLGTGFVSFIAGEIGQRILLKAGLVPEYMPPRLIVLPEKED